jgi:hypothetical protein
MIDARHSGVCQSARPACLPEGSQRESKHRNFSLRKDCSVCYEGPGPTVEVLVGRTTSDQGTLCARGKGKNPILILLPLVITQARKFRDKYAARTQFPL